VVGFFGFHHEKNPHVVSFTATFPHLYAPKLSIFVNCMVRAAVSSANAL
jgi:dihydrodipicolinate reductase